ncbi:hypothetical protein, partial [Vibrio lentus]|uniref:hypothetical protein n=1 Tax=Vibrio lentus TaxID=136468 RepID=UPI001A7E1157
MPQSLIYKTLISKNLLIIRTQKRSPSGKTVFLGSIEKLNPTPEFEGNEDDFIFWLLSFIYHKSVF